MEDINKAYATFAERDRIASLGGGAAKIDIHMKNGIKNAVKSGCFLTKFITYPPSQTVCSIAKAYNRLAYPNRPAYFCCRLPCLIYLMLYLMSYLQFYPCVPLI